MNRLTAASLLYEAELGKQVIVVSENTAVAYGAFRQVHELGQHLGLVKKARFSEGNNWLGLWNGTVSFHSLRQGRSLQGRKADLIYVEHVYDRRALHILYDDYLRPLRARGAEVVIE